MFKKGSLFVFFSLFFLLLALTPAQGKVALAPGDIAFTGFNADGNDNIAFVALVDINAGTTIYFEDNEWNATSSSFKDTNEGAFSWTSTSLVSAGTVVLIDNIGSGTITANVGTAVDASALSPSRGTNRGISGGDEVIYAYQGDAASPAFIAAIANGGFSSANGDLPAGLTLGTNAINLGSLDDDADIAAYTGSRSGEASFSAYLPIINNPSSNWVMQDASGDQSADSTAPDVPFDSTAFSITAQTNLMRITEYMYTGYGAEFIEFTNVGTTSVDMTGWSFDDDSGNAGTFSLSAFGTVQPGESVILTESDAAAFRTAWGLCNGVKVIGGLSANLGREDEINLYDGNTTPVLVDRLTYGDQTYSSGSIRTQNFSGWVSAAGLGANNILEWTLSSLSDAEASYASSGGDIGSPGKSTRATVPYNPCPATNAPVIAFDISTNNFVDGGIIIPPVSSFGTSGVISDPTDPVSQYGIEFDITDSDTPIASVTVTAASSDQTVVPDANINVTGSGTADVNVKITPAGVGKCDITITANDGTNQSTFIISYASSAASSTPGTTRFHTGSSDASTAVALDSSLMFVADDEGETLRLYDRDESGLPKTSSDMTASLTVIDGKEVDIEGSFKKGSRIFWMGSHGNNKEGKCRPDRSRIFATDISGTGDTATLNFVGEYDNFRTDLITWGNLNGYDFDSSTYCAGSGGKLSELIDGFNIEGFTLAPDGSTAYVAFRAPLVPTSNRTKALIAPIPDFETWFNNGAPAGSPTIGNPIELNLGGRGIRSMECNGYGCIIIAGDYGTSGNFKLYTWNPGTGVLEQRAADLSALHPESIVDLPAGDFMGSNGDAVQIQLLSDNGDTIFYNDGIIAKELSDDNKKKFRSDWITIGTVSLIPSSSIKKIVVCDLDNNNVDDVVRLDSNGDIYYSTDLANWTHLAGELGKDIACGDLDSNNLDDIAGINFAGNIYYSLNVTSGATWTQSPGSLEKVWIGELNGDANGNIIGLNSINQIYQTNDRVNWTNIPGLIKEIAIGNFSLGRSGNEISGLNSGGNIYYTTDMASWLNVAGILSKLYTVDFNADNTAELLGINSQNNIYYSSDLSSWTPVNGILKNLAVGNFDAGGLSDDIAGTGADNSIWFTLNSGASWTNIPGLAVDLKTGNFGGDAKTDIVVIGGNGNVYWSSDLGATWNLIN